MFNRLQSFRAIIILLGREVVAEYTSDPESGTLKLSGIPAEDIIDFMQSITKPAAPMFTTTTTVNLDGDAIAKAVENSSLGKQGDGQPEAPPVASTNATPAEGDDKPRRTRRTKAEMEAERAAKSPPDPRQVTLPETAPAQPTSNGAAALATPDAPLAARAPAVAPTQRQPPAPDPGHDIPFGKEKGDPNDPWGMEEPGPSAAPVAAPPKPAPPEPPTVQRGAVPAAVDAAVAAHDAAAASLHPGVSVETAASKPRLADLLSYLIDDVGIRTVTELVATCEALKSQVPLLSRISDLAERVPRTLTAIDLDLPV